MDVGSIAMDAPPWRRQTLAAMLANYLRQVWSCRFFWLSLAWGDIRRRYHGSVFGLAWSMLHPLAMTAVLCAAFHTIFQIDVRNYGPYIFAGLTFWAFITHTVDGGCRVFIQSHHFICQHTSPLVIYPLRHVLSALFNFAVGVVTVVLATLVIRGWTNPITLLTLIPTMVLCAIFGWSLATIAGIANARFRDVEHLTTVLFQILFYATPIIYPADVMETRGFGAVLKYNPMTSFIQMIRAPVLDGAVPDAFVVSMAVGVTAASFVIASLLVTAVRKTLVYDL